MDYDRRERIAALDRQIGILRTNADRAQARGDVEEAADLHRKAEEFAGGTREAVRRISMMRERGSARTRRRGERRT